MCISLIYNRLFEITRDSHFKNESEFWKSTGFDYPESDQGYAGFYVDNENEKLAYGVLNGITGIVINNIFYLR